MPSSTPDGNTYDVTATRQRRIRGRCNIGASSLIASFLVIFSAAIPRMFYPPDLPTFLPEQISQLSSGLVVVVTGANSGLGFDTVRHLVVSRTRSSTVSDDDENNQNIVDEATPSIVVMACRNEAKCEKAKQQILAEATTTTAAAATTSDNKTNAPNTLSTKILTLQLDLLDPISIQRFAQQLPIALNSTSSTVGRDIPIDALINNAGVFTRDPSGIVYHNGTDEHILVNHLGHVRLLHHLWPKLIRDKTRIVTVSSIAALLPITTTSDWYDTNKKSTSLLSSIWKCAIVVPSLIQRIGTGMISYGRSKRANLVFAQELHRRYSSLGISSVASHPGIASTELWSKGAKIFPAAVANFLQTSLLTSHSSYDGAATQVWAAMDHEAVPSGYYVGPRWWFRGIPVLLGPLSTNNNGNHRHSGALQPTNNDYNKIRALRVPIPHFWPFSVQEGSQLWEQSLQALGIEEFGNEM
ncbi:short-chain dehydrogenase/reductase family protein [Nitzschia inconspicua]|uniref:Short-chain dehydrogenase/reductase family protein n=1 Tax=Nitzschia inconspicua TaxID=303405 RepID=A0A9K3LHB9_9STRA|nr:short-chain dehydrogenase/reductase family protein [Nitzschia inconspicua]